ncbi:MAG: Co2+/Mg2+ efflux protein ApaG [Gammaproteobacteria bacterium]|nr:Co2+/Mg2+ efflux protein ApaG [Gammaproteobacteria bacterium]
MNGFEVSVEPRYILAESDPAKSRFVFAYTITIANHGEEAAQLLNRYWLITNGDGKRQEVRGPGVVGNQPRIAPGEAFRYTSACILETAVGSMGGHYEFVSDAGEHFDVPIATFSLAVPDAVH